MWGKGGNLRIITYLNWMVDETIALTKEDSFELTVRRDIIKKRRKEVANLNKYASLIWGLLHVHHGIDAEEILKKEIASLEIIIGKYKGGKPLSERDAINILNLIMKIISCLFSKRVRRLL